MCGASTDGVKVGLWKMDTCHGCEGEKKDRLGMFMGVSSYPLVLWSIRVWLFQSTCSLEWV